MRISTAQLHEQGLISMLDRQTELAYTQQQLSTGKRILSPADDVLGTTQVLALQQVIDSHQQYSRNTDFAQARLQQEEVSITQVIDVLQRAHDLAIQSTNSTLDAQSRAAIAPEVRQELDSILGVATFKFFKYFYKYKHFNGRSLQTYMSVFSN